MAELPFFPIQNPPKRQRFVQAMVFAVAPGLRRKAGAALGLRGNSQGLGRKGLIMTSFIQSISEAFSHGGLLMWAIIPVQIVSLAIIAERVIALYFRRDLNQKKVVQIFEEDIRKGKLDLMMEKAKRAESHPIAVVALAGAQATRDLAGKDEVQLRMDEVLLEEQTRLEKRTGFLAMLGNVATLLGLLGTITGMIKSFAAVGTANATEKAALLASGISEAMNATAYGLVVAVPALVMYAVLQNRTNQLSDDLNKAALKLFIWLTYNFETVSSSKRKSM
jgi:biopolymer transport protein ExbB